MINYRPDLNIELDLFCSQQRLAFLYLEHTSFVQLPPLWSIIVSNTQIQGLIINSFRFIEFDHVHLQSLAYGAEFMLWRSRLVLCLFSHNQSLDSPPT